VYYLCIYIYIISHNIAHIYIYVYYHNTGSQAGEKSQVSYLRGPPWRKLKCLSMIPFPLSSITKVCEKTGAMPSCLGENTFFPGNPKKRMKQIEHDVWLYLYKYYMFYLFRGCYNLPIFLNTGSVSHFRDAALRWDKALEHSHSAPSNSPGEMVVLWGFDGVSMGKPHTYII
jgi:hypothetical protein